MRIKLIGCISTKNEVLAMQPGSPADCVFFDFSLHACPGKLHRELQQTINTCQDYDKIILTYGRCSRAVEGLASARVPLVLPNAHDCISVLLGSDLRRQEQSARNPAAYYFSQGWLDYGRNPYDEYLEYIEKYGQDKAHYLIQSLYGAYREAIFIRTAADRKKIEEYRQKVKQIASFFGWKISEVAGDLELLNAVVNQLSHPGVIRVAPGTPIVLEEGIFNAD
ncbi:DUF1638 domain-containing protein [Sporomusa aerivorans]|uniref:DUF1638 domain-containing protein n=1 Tax=Sporomusa aerivorans TaxID=204936 RepID=UPI00352A84F0